MVLWLPTWTLTLFFCTRHLTLLVIYWRLIFASCVTCQNWKCHIAQQYLSNDTHLGFPTAHSIWHKIQKLAPLLSSDGSNTILSNIERTRTSFFKHRTNSTVFIYWYSNSNTRFLASNDRTSNFEPNRAFTRFTKSLIQLTRTSLFRTNLNMFIYWYSNSNTLFLASNNRTSNFEHCSTHHYWIPT